MHLYSVKIFLGRILLKDFKRKVDVRRNDKMDVGKRIEIIWIKFYPEKGLEKIRV